MTHIMIVRLLYLYVYSADWATRKYNWSPGDVYVFRFYLHFVFRGGLQMRSGNTWKNLQRFSIGQEISNTMDASGYSR